MSVKYGENHQYYQVQKSWNGNKVIRWEKQHRGNGLISCPFHS